MTTSRLIRAELKKKKIPRSTIYDRISQAKAKTGNSISDEVALDVVASQSGLNVSKLLKKEGRLDELRDFMDVMAKFDFGTNILRRPKVQTLEKRVDRSPYELPLSRYNIDQELIDDCRINSPYRKAVSEAMLTLETRIRKTLGLSDTFTGVDLISEAQKKGVFARTVQSEEQGLNLLYRGAVMWLRNPSGHRKVQYSKEDSVKVVLFADYLIKLFDDLFHKRI
jgi:hypothetical protein